MTTEATQQPQNPQPPVMDVAEVYRTLGRLEEGQLQTREQLARIDQRLDRHEERNDLQFTEVNRRVDRVWYTIVGAAVAILAGMAGLAVQNALMG
jgi:hypothetical protein